MLDKRCYIDETGNRYGMLTVIDLARKDIYSHVYWLCKCDCGEKLIVRGSNLRQGHTQSCGCWGRKNIIQMNKDRTLKSGLAAMRLLIGQYKRRALKRGLPYELDEETFAWLTQKPCHYCGQEPSQVYGRHHINGEYIYNGLDRVDNSKGYILDNVVTCCKYCNQAKSNRSEDEFSAWISRVFFHVRK